MYEKVQDVHQWLQPGFKFKECSTRKNTARNSQTPPKKKYKRNETRVNRLTRHQIKSVQIIVIVCE